MSFINGICFLYFYNLWNKLSDIVKVIGIFVWITQVTSYTYTVLINPGLVKPEMSLELFHSSKYKETVKNYRICSICKVIKNTDEETAHCDDCDTCIEGNSFII